LPEALERWPISLFEDLLPRHLMLIYEINLRFLRRVQTRWPGDMARLGRMSIIEEGSPKQVRMTHLATVGSHSINGVARLHTDLLKSQLLSDFYEMWPERFNNKTNGVSPRRWILYSNPRLTKLISSRLGPEWIDRDLGLLSHLTSYADDAEFLDALDAVKQENKADLAEVVLARTGIALPSDAIYVVQVKRIHEYKRQLLAALHIVALYIALKRKPKGEFVPRVYIFAGKAAPGYVVAKLHIKLINDIAAMINSDPAVRGKLTVVFLPNYGVSLAQSIIPAADVSLQISTAGKEASGTSNMKFALNGALTIGTLDGANVEIREAVGPENFFLFGLRADEVVTHKVRGYVPAQYIARSPALAEALALIESGFFSLGEPARFKSVTDNLRHHDPYMICADFEGYTACEAHAAEAYRDRRAWSKSIVYNIAGTSRFSSDNTIRQYASEIWDIKPLSVDVALLADAI
jgi:starch phosphorylase